MTQGNSDGVDSMAAHIAKLDALLHRERGIHVTVLCHPQGFEWMMFDAPLRQPKAIARRIEKGQAERIDELRKLRQYHPKLWARLLEMDDRAKAQFGVGPLGQFKQRWSVGQLEARFSREEMEGAHEAPVSSGHFEKNQKEGDPSARPC